MAKKKIVQPVNETPVETENAQPVNETPVETPVETENVESKKPQSKIQAGVIFVTAEEAQSDEFRKYGIRSKGIWRIHKKKDGFRVEHLST